MLFVKADRAIVPDHLDLSAGDIGHGAELIRRIFSGYTLSNYALHHSPLVAMIARGDIAVCY